jgi:class 3 adenylate cyclase
VPRRSETVRGATCSVNTTALREVRSTDIAGMLDTAGDGLFASDGRARAIRCAQEIVTEAAVSGLGIRAGLHTGECELLGDKLAGVAVNAGARIAAAASGGEILVSSTVKDLVAGSGFTFEERGTQELKGLGEWPLYAVAPFEQA